MAKKAVSRRGPPPSGRKQVGFSMRPEVLALARMAAAVKEQRHGAFIEAAIMAAVERVEKETGARFPRPEGFEA